MASTGQFTSAEVAVEEYGYGLGPPTGILVLRYPPSSTPVEFPEFRDDYVHQVVWSPDGMLAVARGGTHRFLGPDEALWVRRGSVFSARGCDRQTVYRVCLREVPPVVQQVPAGTLGLGPAAGAIRRLGGPGVSQEEGLTLRRVVVDALAASPTTALDHHSGGSGLARVVAAALAADPADDTSLEAWAGRLHTSVKTLQRDFVREYELSFSAWRTRLRLQASLALLALHPVTETAHRVGYSSASAFVAAFTKEYGETPGRRTTAMRRAL